MNHKHFIYPLIILCNAISIACDSYQTSIELIFPDVDYHMTDVDLISIEGDYSSALFEKTSVYSNSYLFTATVRDTNTLHLGMIKKLPDKTHPIDLYIGLTMPDGSPWPNLSAKSSLYQMKKYKWTKSKCKISAKIEFEAKPNAYKQ